MTVAVTCIAWFSEDRPFAVGFADGKLLIGHREPEERGGIVLIDAHKVKYSLLSPRFSCLVLSELSFQFIYRTLTFLKFCVCHDTAID